MSYENAMEKAGAIVHRFKRYGSYQGDWMAEVTYEGKHGYVRGSYGSCSGCDAYEAEIGSLSHYDEEGENYHSVTWGDIVEGCEQCKADEEAIANFGRGYLNHIYSKEEIIAELEKGFEWAWEKDEVIEKIRWVDSSWDGKIPNDEPESSIVIEGIVDELRTEDNGSAKIAEVSDGKEEGVWTSIVSWSEKGNHSFVENLEGKKVKVTIEVID